MKTKQVLSVMITSLFLLCGCSNNEGSVEESGLASENSTLSKTEYGSKGSSVTNQEYKQAQAAVIETFGAIATSITLGAGHGYDGEYMDQLISFHAYGDKFTEFNNEVLTGSEGNEQHERQLFGEDLYEDGVLRFGFVPGTLKVAVYYGNVANLTFISDFILKHKSYDVPYIRVHNLITLLFVKTQGEWKMVHEHHSPADISELTLEPYNPS